MADDKNNVIISRIQNRRGLKQDLPQPLRPGEIGFALDTRQVFIGADPNYVDSSESSTSVFETTSGAIQTTVSIANNQLIYFTVPFKKLPRATFNGITLEQSWFPTDTRDASSELAVFSTNITSGANSNISIKHIQTNNKFNASDSSTLPGSEPTGILVLKNGILLDGDSVNSSPRSNAEYSFSSSISSGVEHTLRLRTAPTAADELSICYYSNTAIITAIESTGPIYPGTNIRGFYSSYNIPSYRQIPRELITVSPTTGTGLIGLQHKHYAVTADSNDTIESPTSLNLGNLILSRMDQFESTNTSVSNSTITFSVAATTKCNVDGLYNYVYVKPNSNPTNIYLYDKLFRITGQGAGYVEVEVPSNASTISRLVTLHESANANLLVCTGNVEGISANSNVYFISYSSQSSLMRNVTTNISTGVGNVDLICTGNVEGIVANCSVYLSGDDANSNITGLTYTVNFANSSAFIVKINADDFDANIDSNISFIGYNETGNVIVFSPDHRKDDNDYVKLYDSSNSSIINNDNYLVSNVTNNTLVLPLSGIIEDVSFNLSNVFYNETYQVQSANTTSFVINVADNTIFQNEFGSSVKFNGFTENNDAIVYSKLHGHTTGNTVKITNSSNVVDLPDTSYIVTYITDNTFSIPVGGDITADTSCDVSPVLSSSYIGLEIAPTLSIDLSSATTVNGISALVNSATEDDATSAWCTLNILPASSSRVFLTHRDYLDSIGFDFKIHEDPVTPTAAALKLETIEYGKHTTVKAKLEKWISEILRSDNVNIFSSAAVASKYSNTGVDEINTADSLDIDYTFNEINFNSREEARDFNKTVNSLYFEKFVNRGAPDSKGLVNLKTNIELQTRTAAVVGDKTVSYTEMNTATIAASGGNINDMTQSTSSYDSYLIDYTISEATYVTDKKYQRMGTMYISARADFDSGNGNILFRDVSSEMGDSTDTGNVVFSASFVSASNSIIISAENYVDRDLVIKYLVKRWSSDLS